ncbi:MAG: ATP-binding protein [Cyanobacterium sp.]
MFEKVNNSDSDHHLRLQILSNLDEVENLLNWFEKHYQSHIPTNIWLQAQTLLIEGFSNGVRHAHKHEDEDTLISLELEIYPHHLQIKIWDQGLFFDLASALQNLQVKLASDDLNLFERESQWGFIFFLKLRDEFGWSIDYINELEQGNCLKVRSPDF